MLEHHKRDARRNFLLASKHEQEQIKERYKPKNLKGGLRLKSTLPEKTTNFSEDEFRLKVKESVNRLQIKEKGQAEKIFYTHLSTSRRADNAKEKFLVMQRNCR